MASSSVERELVGLEKKYWQAIIDKDFEAALELTDDPCIVAGAQGVASIGRKEFEGMMKSEQWTLNKFELDDIQVRMLGDDTAVVAYKVKEQLTVEGKPLTLEAADASTWVRKNGHWVCALHTEALAGDPFGRDRKAVRPS
jgi:uncharacterized protein (TIGR02246 family)